MGRPDHAEFLVSETTSGTFPGVVSVSLRARIATDARNEVIDMPRRPGTKNRPKDVIAAEKAAKEARKAAKVKA